MKQEPVPREALNLEEALEVIAWALERGGTVRAYPIRQGYKVFEERQIKIETASAKGRK